MRFEAKEKTRLDAARAFLGPPEPPTPIGIVNSPYEASFAPGLCYATSKTKPYPPRRTCRVPAQRPTDSLRLPREECGEASREDTAPDLYRCPRCTRRWRRQTTLFTLLSIIYTFSERHCCYIVRLSASSDCNNNSTIQPNHRDCIFRLVYYIVTFCIIVNKNLCRT